jgi:hypothetical protein
MNIIEDLKNRIKLSTSRIELALKQLEEYESGAVKRSLMSVSSIELSVERNRFLLDKYTQKLKRLESKNIKEVEENEKKKQSIRENNYFKYQSLRIKHDKTKTKKEIHDALYILNDIPSEMNIEDEEIFAISHKSKEVFLEIHSDLDDELIEIRSEFLDLIENNFNNTNNELKLLNYRIPIIILQLRILLKNIKENLDEDKLNTNKFTGLPKFEDWWIHELWTSHQAYMGLFRWKEVVLSLCISTEQKSAFDIIFKNWILIKKILNVKAGYGYFYNKAFDDMICKYAGLEDEYAESNLKQMKDIVFELTKNENFTSVSKDHDIVTPYMQFKIEKKLENEKTKEDML